MAARKNGYGGGYEKARAELLASNPPCHICGGPGADSADHDPPLALHTHLEDSGCCRLLPAHLDCNQITGGWAVVAARRRLVEAAPRVIPPPSRVW